MYHHFLVVKKKKKKANPKCNSKHNLVISEARLRIKACSGKEKQKHGIKKEKRPQKSSAADASCVAWMFCFFFST